MAHLTYTNAEHLLGRMGFGGSPDEINLLSKKREKAVDRLVDYQKIDNTSMDSSLTMDFPFLGISSSNAINDQNFNETEIRSWWIARMLLTERPFEEKMTLFWHNFFATSLDKVPVVHMYEQNLDLRSLALTRFDDLLLKVSQGAAMLIWLDGALSTRTEPNENFARELQEVFTMGTHDVVTGEPNYTEDDVKEIARAFTGWRFRKSSSRSPFAYEWYLDESEADLGAKTIYGQTAAFTGQDVITVIANRRSTGRFLVKRLFEFFVYTLDLNSAGDMATIEKFTDVYFANGHSIGELVRSIFKSDEFFSDRAYRSLIKTPADFIVGAMKRLGVDFIYGTPATRNLSLISSLKNMGMNLFSPPDVFGWKLNLGFVTDDAMLERFNIADQITSPSRTDSSSPGIGFGEFSAFIGGTPDATLQTLLDVLGPFDLDADVVAKLLHYLTTKWDGTPFDWADQILRLIKVKNASRLIMCLPEFQMS